MIRALYTRLALTLTGVFLVVGVLFVLLTLGVLRYALVETQQQLHRDLAHNLVTDRLLVREGRLDPAAMEQTFHDYMVINPSIELYLLDTSGRILAYSADPGKVKRNQVSLDPIRRFLDGTEHLPLLGDDPRSHDQRKTFSVTPVPSRDAPQGYLYVILRGEEIDRLDALIQRSWLLRLGAGTATLSLALGLLLGLLLFWLLTRRLRRLGRAMTRFRDGDFKPGMAEITRARSGSGDEIDRLEDTFAAMAGRISDQLRALADQDQLRRDLIAQVSHDLRTPLASLHGYLETLQLKEGRLDGATRREFLDIALRHSRRLQRLVEDLFELAKLDARDVQPLIEPMAIGDLAQDIVQKYALAASRKGVQLRLTGPADLPLVRADIGLIERVLENLIANAIEHTPVSGAVRIGVGPEPGGVRIEVADSGHGIPAEVLPRIFERWFQAESPDGGRSGLGLAIAKRIIDLHGSCLEVASQVGVGSRFSFRLAAA